jgi:hypothetical protein
MSSEPVARQRWAEPQWPWALELLTLLMLAVGLATPLILSAINATPGQGPQDQRGLGALLWPALLMGYYILHLMVARASVDRLSTPLIHLLSPTLAAVLSYLALARSAAAAGLEVSVLSGGALDLVLLVLIMLSATLLLARVSMRWMRRRFRSITWEITSPNRVDRSIWAVAAQVYPLVFPPLRYLGCPDGLLVEGWHFLVIIPFDDVRSVSKVRFGNVEASGHYFATAAQDLIRIDCSDSTMPIFLSPVEHEQVLHYCSHHVGRRRQPTSRGTHPGVSGRTQRTSFYKTSALTASASTDRKPAG